MDHTALTVDHLTLFGVSATIIIPLVVQACKKWFGLPKRYAPPAAAGVALIIYILGQIMFFKPETIPGIQQIFNIVLLALSGSGLYSVTNYYNKERKFKENE